MVKSNIQYQCHNLQLYYYNLYFFSPSVSYTHLPRTRLPGEPGGHERLERRRAERFRYSIRGHRSVVRKTAPSTKTSYNNRIQNQ